MSTSLRIALVHPHAVPARDDVAHHVAAEAAALAARGHHVTLLAPATRRDLILAGRARLTAAAGGDVTALVAAPGQVLEVAIGRALPTGPGRRMGEPFDLAGALETALSRTAFDVVHLHEPLAPGPALAAMRHASGVTAVTFHRAEPLEGVAFLRPLVDRALARAHLRIATTPTGRDVLSQMLPGDYRVIAPGIDPCLFSPLPAAPAGPPGLVVVARGRDRVAVRFGVSVLRGLDLDAVGPVTLIGPADAPWRTRAAVPKALRDRVAVVPDPGPAGRATILAHGAIVVVCGPDEAAGPVLREALAMRRVVVAPRCAATGDAVAGGHEAVELTPFSRDAWTDEVATLVASGAAAAPAPSMAPRTWNVAAAELESAYRDALDAGRRTAEGVRAVTADLRVRLGRDLTPARLVAACAARGIGVVGVAGPGGVADARAVAALAPVELTVIAGQEVTTTDGVLIGLFLSRDVPAGLSPAAAATAIRERGGLVVVPHPASLAAPPADVLRHIAAEIDCHEVLTGQGDDDADDDLLRRLGLRVIAASGATRPEDVGAAATVLRPFSGPADLLDALGDARLSRPDRRRRPRERTRRNRSRES